MNNKSINIALEVNAYNYNSSVEHLASEFVYMDRTHKYQKKNTQIDVFGPIWIVGFANLPENKISIKNGNEYISLSGPCGFFAPPFSIVEWKIQPGELKWEATLANCQLPACFQKNVFTFTWNQTIPKNFEALMTLLNAAENKIIIEPQSYSSSLAEKVKNYIDSNYTNNLPISQIADDLNLSWSFMSREFRKVYNLSPVEYRHKARLFSAIKLLSLGRSVTDSCLESGFSSISQFNLQFKKYLGTIPTNYSKDKNPTQKPLKDSVFTK